ncbi:HIT family protein [Patescibacteria group bacterium]
MSKHNCVFCKIANKQITSSIIYENQNNIAFLDINPAMLGQVVVISKQHVTSDFKKVADNILQETIVFTKKIALAVDRALNTRSCIVVEGFDIDHLHFKVYPTTKEKHLKINPQISANLKDLESIKQKISKFL